VLRSKGFDWEDEAGFGGGSERGRGGMIRESRPLKSTKQNLRGSFAEPLVGTSVGGKDAAAEVGKTPGGGGNKAFIDSREPSLSAMSFG